MEEPPLKKARDTFFDNERFELFYQEFYTKVSEEVETHTCRSSDEEDYSMRRVQVSSSTTGEEKEQNTPLLRTQQHLAGPSTSTQHPDEAYVSPDFGTKRSSENLPNTQLTEDFPNNRKCINLLPGQCTIVFVEEGTFVPSRDLTDTVVRFMMPNNFWSKMQIGPPRSNSKYHFYLVVQDRLPPTETTNNQLAGKSYVMVAIRQAVLKKDSLTYIKNLARLTVSQYISPGWLQPDQHSLSWENSTSNDPIACEVMCVENLSFNPFTRIGRVKSDELWKKVSSSVRPTNTKESTTKRLHEHKLQVDFKPMPTSTLLAEKTVFNAELDNRHNDKPDCLVISKFVYVIPRITHKPANKKRERFKPNVEPTDDQSSYAVSEAVSESEEDIKFQIPEVPPTRDPMRKPFSEFGNSFAENQVVEIPFETYCGLVTSLEGECSERDLGKNETTHLAL